MLEQWIEPATFQKILYALGCGFELVGFAFLFAFDKTVAFFKKSKFLQLLLAFLLIAGGYFLAVAVRT
jgi:hypothetical protein